MGYLNPLSGPITVSGGTVDAVVNPVLVGGGSVDSVTNPVDANVTGPVTVAGGSVDSVTNPVDANVTSPVTVAGGSVDSVTNPVDATVTGGIIDTVTNPVTAGGGGVDTVAQPVNVSPSWFWPQVSGQSFPPTFSGSAGYSSYQGLPVVQITSGSSLVSFPTVGRTDGGSKHTVTITTSIEIDSVPSSGVAHPLTAGAADLQLSPNRQINLWVGGSNKGVILTATLGTWYQLTVIHDSSGNLIVTLGGNTITVAGGGSLTQAIGCSMQTFTGGGAMKLGPMSITYS